MCFRHFLHEFMHSALLKNQRTSGKKGSTKWHSKDNQKMQSYQWKHELQQHFKMLIHLWVTVTVQGCFMCETDLGTWCLVGAQSTVVWGQQLVSLVHLHKNQNGLYLLWQEIILGAGPWRRQHWEHTKDKAERLLFVKLSSLHIQTMFNFSSRFKNQNVCY